MWILADFARAHTHLGVGAFAGQQRGEAPAERAINCAAAGLNIDAVDGRTHRMLRMGSVLPTRIGARNRSDLWRPLPNPGER